MNGFRCNVTGSVSNVALAPAQVPRRCGADPQRGVMEATPGNCTYGAKQPFYWFQKERNNVRVRRSIGSSGASVELISPSGRVRCSRGHTPRPSTWTCTTSKTDHRTTSSWTRTHPFLLPARPKRKSPLRSITQSRNRRRRRGRNGSPLRGRRENRAC